MNRETELTLRTPNRQPVANMADVLRQMRRSGSIHFVKSLPKTAFHYPRARQTAKLTLPAPFVHKNAHKMGEWVTLRAQSSSGRSSTSWLVHLCVDAALKVQMVGGWPAFVADNRLKKGDHLIFLFKEDARAEFVVYMFRGPRGSPYFPNEGERSESEEDASDSEKEENPRAHPGFSKLLVASHIGRSVNGEIISLGQFEFPRGFIRTHAEQVHVSVKLQGVHENSPNYVITCRRRPGDLLKFLSEHQQLQQANGRDARIVNFRWQHCSGTREENFIMRKRACLPTAATISEENIVKISLCVSPFTLHQHLKLHQGKDKVST